MSWRNVPKKENYFPLFAEDWNALVDAVDDLYYMLHTLPPPTTGGPLVGGYLYGDMIPWLDRYYSLGDPEHRFLNVWAKNIYADPIWTTTLYASENIFVNDKPVIKDGDPISINDIQSPAQDKLSNLIQQNITIYQQQILNNLSQIQTLLRNTNVLINSHLVRELYNTYSYIFQFNNSSGVIQLFSPKRFYTTIIRGWYAISSGSSGLAQITGQYSLTPVGMIPLSVPLLSIPDIYLSLYYDEPILLYYDNVTLGSYLQLVLNIIEQWTGVTLFRPSGVDPSRYMPPSGWKEFYDFLSQSEVTTPYWVSLGTSIFQVEDSILTMRGIPNTYGSVVYENTNIAPTRIVITFQIRDITGDFYAPFIEYNPANGSVYVDVALSEFTLNPDGTFTTNIVDLVTGQFLVSNITLKQKTWYVLMYDFSNNTFSLHDTSGNVIASAHPTQRSTTLRRTRIMFFVTNGTHTIDIDWLGVG